MTKIIKFKYKNGEFSAKPDKCTTRTVLVLAETPKVITGIDIKADYKSSQIKSFSKKRIQKQLAEIKVF